MRGRRRGKEGGNRERPKEEGRGGRKEREKRESGAFARAFLFFSGREGGGDEEKERGRKEREREKREKVRKRGPKKQNSKTN
jgi:hypothetical protein